MTMNIIPRLIAIGFVATAAMQAQSLQVTSTGVGIGTTTPAEKLEVKGNVKINDATMVVAGAAPIYACRAWVNFDGTRNAAGVADSSNTARYIIASGNVASVTRLDVGCYQVTFAVPMPDANYAITVSSDVSGVNGQSWQSIVGLERANIPPSAGSFRLLSIADAPNGTRMDKAFVSVAVFR